MPPKRAALAQALRDSFTEDISVANIEQWASQTLGQAEEYISKLRNSRTSLAGKTYTATNASTTPREVVEALQQYQAFTREVYLSAEQIRTVIAIRIPELKEEDNLGVAVQMAVLKTLDILQGKLLGSGGDKEGVSAAIGMFGLKEYLSTRGSVEEKLLGKASEDGKPAQGTKAPSALLELQQVDLDALLKAELATVQITTLMRSFINTYALNWKKLIQPRTANDKMIS